MDREVSKPFVKGGWEFLNFQEEGIHPSLKESSHKKQLWDVKRSII